MSRAAVDFVVVEFPGNKIGPKVAEQLRELAERDVIRVVDLVFVTKEADGTVRTAELPELDDERNSAFNAIVQSLDGLVGTGDIDRVASQLAPGTTAAILLLEHTWATWLHAAIDESGGHVHREARIPGEVLREGARDRGRADGRRAASGLLVS